MLVATLLATGCLSDLARGPDLGPCASPPDGVYTYGEVGIGTCLAGPTDLAFFEREGQLWLLVSNANTYGNFDSGSVLSLRWDSIDLTRPRQRVDELDAAALPMPSYNGELGLILDREPPLALVPNRLSEGATTRSALDRTYLLNLSDPANLQLFEPLPELPLQDDPYPVAVMPSLGRAFIGNLTDHSVSVVRAGAPELTGGVGLLDVAPQAQIGRPVAVDGDASGTLAELSLLRATDSTFLRDDAWKLTFVDATRRLYLPEAAGLSLWTSGGNTFDPVVRPVELLQPNGEPSDKGLRDPFLVLVASTPTLYYVDDAGDLRVATSDGTSTVFVESGVALSPAGQVPYPVLGSPSVLTLDGLPALFYDAAESDDLDAAAGIGRSIAADGLTFAQPGEWLIAPDPSRDQLQLRHPFVRQEGPTGGYRVWMSIWNGERWAIGLSESLDGEVWTPPEVVLEAPDAHLAAPAISTYGGRTVLHYARYQEGFWEILQATSADGRRFEDAQVAVSLPGEVDPARPPRAALQVDATSAWRIEGRDTGVLETLLTPGSALDLTPFGFEVRVSAGQELSLEQPGLLSRGGFSPGSAVAVGDRMRLFATTREQGGRERIALLERSAEGEWTTLNGDVVPRGSGGNVLGAGSPVVVQEGDSWVLFYAAVEGGGRARIHRATSTDGIRFQPEARPLFDDEDDWDSLEQRPHSLERRPNGQYRLWFGGNNGSRWRIGAAVGPLRGPLRPESGEFDPWLFSTGTPGDFDDAGVKDPLLVTLDGVDHLWYSGFDGTFWAIGHAVRQPNGTFVRREEPLTGAALPVLVGDPRSFSAAGVEAPVRAQGQTPAEWFYAGFDGENLRLGTAISPIEQALGDPDLAPVLYPTPRYPTAGDEIRFGTERGDPQVSVIELEQISAQVATTGEGMAGLHLDEPAGLLYVPSKLINQIWVVDVRDDSRTGFLDQNALDLETVIEVPNLSTSLGFRQLVHARRRGLLYLLSRTPDAVIAVDVSDLQDNEVKETTRGVMVGSLPLPDLNADRGLNTSAFVGGAGMALSADESLLLVSHFRDNSLTAFDLRYGAYGETVRHIQAIGENPATVRFTPDGRHAVVALITGEVVDSVASSSLAIVDTDPNSSRYLEVLTWIVNR